MAILADMIGRRALLQALTGAGALASTAPSALGVGAIASALSAGGSESDACAVTGLADGSYKILGRLHGLREEWHYVSASRQPAHIASKRSWSSAFKEHVATQEHREIQRMIDALERDDALRKRVCGLLGIL